jgi:glycosyltransferase involved in cell wall biosynthesis
MIIGRFAWNFSVVDEAHKSAEFKKDIHFIGSVHGEDLVDIVGCSEGLIFVSHFEGFGLPIIEAMKAEVPVITSGLSSMAEIGDDAVIQVEPNDIEMIADAIHNVAVKKKTRESLIKRGKIREKKFRWPKTAEKVCSILETYAQTVPAEEK